MNPRFLKPLGQDDTKHFFNAVRFKRQQDLTARKLNYSWESIGHKVYPSSIRSLTMCPKRFVYEDVHKPPSFDTPVVYSLELGKSIHEMLQTAGLEIPDLYWEEPDYSGYVTHSKELVEELELIRKAISPEVPVKDPVSGISGRADMVLNVYGSPVVFDIKTTSIEDFKYDEKTNSVIEYGRWSKKCQKLPSEDHKIQVAIYCHLMNKYQLFSEPIRKAGLGYLNLAMKPGDPAAEFEVYFDFDEEYEEKIANLIRHIGIQRQAYLQKEEVECEYRLCRAHNLKRTLEEAKNEQ